MANNFKNPWDVGGEYYNQNALHTEFLPKDAAYFTGVNPNTGESVHDRRVDDKESVFDVLSIDSKGIISNSRIAIDIIKEIEKGQLRSVVGIVLHRTVSSTGKSTINAFKTGRDGVNYGTHFLVDEFGNILQTASLNYYTLHVGKTRKKSYPQNTNSIGIEVVGNYSVKNGWDPLTANQIDATTWLTGSLLQTYNLGKNDVYSHDVISYKTAGEGTIIYNAIMPTIRREGLLRRSDFSGHSGIIY
jgi:hypothetical protein